MMNFFAINRNTPFSATIKLDYAAGYGLHQNGWEGYITSVTCVYVMRDGIPHETTCYPNANPEFQEFLEKGE